MKNPLRDKPKIVRLPCYMIILSMALLFDAVLFIAVSDWLSIFTFLLAFLLLTPSIILLLAYAILIVFRIIRDYVEDNIVPANKKPKPKVKRKNKKIELSDILDPAFISTLIYYIYIKIIQKITKYYPFSSFFRNTLYHYENRDMKRLIFIIYNITQYKLRKKFTIRNVERDENFHTLYGRFGVRIKENTLNQMRKELAVRFHVDPNFIYINQLEDGVVRINISNDIANSEDE